MTQSEIYLKQLLKDFRLWWKNSGITQQEIAFEFEITRSHLNKIMNERTNPSLQIIKKMEEKCYKEQTNE